MPRGDDLGPAPQIAFPRLTPAVKAMLIGLAVLFVVELVDVQWLQKAFTVRWLALFPRLVTRGQVWRLATYPLVQPLDISAAFWGGVTLYFFGTSLEDSFGTRRFVLFTALLVILSGLIATAYGAVHSVFFTEPVFGISSLGFAMTAAWGTRFPNQKLLFPPVSGRVLVFITIGLAALSILARSQRESPAASLGAIAVGWLLARYWDRIDDFLDRRRVQRLRAKRERILRAIPGGLDDRSKKRPIDKRYLN